MGCLFKVSKALLLFLAVFVALAVFTHPGRVAASSAGLMIEVFPSSPAYPLRWFTATPIHEEVRYPVGESEDVAQIYRPADSDPHGAMVLYIGVSPAWNDPNLVRVAKGLARTGVVVMLPESRLLADFRIDPNGKQEAISAFEYLSKQKYVDPKRISLMGISVGGSLASLAAEDPRISHKVKMLVLLGSYYDASDMLSAVTTRKIKVDGDWEKWEPEPVTVNVFSNTLLPMLPESDRKPLASLFDQKTRQIPNGLSPRGEAVARLLVNRDPLRVPELIAGLPPDVRAMLAKISPSTHIGDLRAKLVLLHDRHDDVIPFTESVHFYHSATNVRSKSLELLDVFSHVQPTGANVLILARELPGFYKVVYGVLSQLT